MTPTISVPSSVISGVTARWPEIGSNWAQKVLGEFDELCSRYRVTSARVLPARFGFVVAVEARHGRTVMRSTPDPDALSQGAVARALAGHGVAPEVHEVFSTGAGTWTIMDEVVPGVSLVEIDPSVTSVDAVADLFRRIIDRPAPSLPGMQGIADWLRHRLVDPDTTDLPIGQTVAPEWDRRYALSLLDELVATGAVDRLCHGDSYPGNVLIGPEGRLLWIDPRGVAGEVSYDVAVFALKASRHVVAHAQAMASYVATRADIEADRAQSWVIVANAARV